MATNKMIGYACAYTPLALIHSFGFQPYRVLPVGDSPDQAGRLLHDNLCPHVKRILDRAMSDDLPELSGMVFINSCDAMRRLFDAWRKVRPQDPCVLLDLPTTTTSVDQTFFTKELERLTKTLAGWSGRPFDPERLLDSNRQYNSLAAALGGVREKAAAGKIPDGARILQGLYTRAATTSFSEALQKLEQIKTETADNPKSDTVPIYLFGNMMPETEAFSMLESCGVRIVGEDLCTGSRLFSTIPVAAEDAQPVLVQYASGILNRPPCARTMKADQPGKLAEDVIAAAREYGAQGVIGYTIKFCDPYISRLPGIRSALREAALPFLFLEGDCTVRTMGQQKTRIEAFIEMLR